MNDFDSRWQACAARARQVRAGDSHAPLGFSARIVARANLNPRPDLAQVWQGLVTRLLAGSVVLFLVCAAFEWPHLREPATLRTGVENTVAQLLWSL